MSDSNTIDDNYDAILDHAFINQQNLANNPPEFSPPNRNYVGVGNHALLLRRPHGKHHHHHHHRRHRHQYHPLYVPMPSDPQHAFMKRPQNSPLNTATPVNEGQSALSPNYPYNYKSTNQPAHPMYPNQMRNPLTPISQVNNVADASPVECPTCRSRMEYHNKPRNDPAIDERLSLLQGTNPLDSFRQLALALTEHQLLMAKEKHDKEKDVVDDDNGKVLLYCRR